MACHLTRDTVNERNRDVSPVMMPGQNLRPPNLADLRCGTVFLFSVEDILFPLGFLITVVTSKVTVKVIL